MGLSDRDYATNREAHDLRPPQSSSARTYWILPLFSVVLLVAMGPPDWMPKTLAAEIQSLRQHLGFLQAPRTTAAPIDHGRETLAPLSETPVVDAQGSALSDLVVRRCLVDGVVVQILTRHCPPSSLPAEVPTPTPVVNRGPEIQENPFVKAGTIYRCKSYGGGVFWAQAHCSQHKAVIERIASVPIGMPFQQQVNVAEGELQSAESSLRAEQLEGDREAFCLALKFERERIWKRSGSGSGYGPLDQLGADQTRWKQIESQMSQNNCRR